MGLETLAIVGAGAALASTGLSVYSGIEQANTQAAFNEYNAEVNRRNAENAQDEAAIAAQQQRRSNSRMLASIRARQGAAGNVDTGSAIESLTDTAGQFEMEALDIERQGNIASDQFEARANIQQIRADSARKSAPYAALGRGLQGGNRVLAIASGL